MKMKKTKLVIFFLTSLLLLLTAPVFAQSRVVDNAGLLSAGEISELKRLIANIAQVYDFDLVIVTEKSIGDARPMDYADDFFDYSGYGLGGDRDGCLFLQVTGSRDYWFSTSGRGIGILNSAAFDKLNGDVLKFLKRGEPIEAYLVFISSWEKFLILDAKGKRYNYIQAHAPAFYLVAWIVSLIIAFIALGIMKAKMNTARPKTEADRYIIPGSLVFTRQQDIFLYCTISKTAREANSSSSSGSHTSSSGRSHGGGGGHY
jgi:uncharacterized protein